MSILDSLKWDCVRAHYDSRLLTHQRLLSLHQQGDRRSFAELVLGVSDAAGNYSASEHGLGPRVLLNPNADRRISDIAQQFIALDSAREVPDLIQRARLGYFGISVGSEVSCMVNPKVCWVANTRTVWAYLVVKHNDNTARADEELRLYRDSDESSEMAYHKWAAIHATLEVPLVRLAEDGEDRARRASVEPGGVVYLWADAIAAHLYTQYHPRGRK